MVPGNGRVLEPNTGVGTEMVWKGNFDRHQWHRGREGAGLLLQRRLYLMLMKTMKVKLLLVLGGEIMLERLLCRLTSNGHQISLNYTKLNLGF